MTLISLLRRLRYAMLSVTSYTVKPPVVFINGATGTGKTKLSVAIAQRFNGEIINADAMQLYKGLDIVTNKVTDEEAGGIRHHLLDILEPTSFSYTIHQFKKHANEAIEDITSRDKMAVVVGGTNYYLDSLLWNSLIPMHESDDEDESSRFSPQHTVPSEQTLAFILQDSENSITTASSSSNNMTSDNEIVQGLDTNYLRLHLERVDQYKLHRLLQRIDPETAKKLHPHQTRKTVRAVEVYKQHGKAQSEFLAEINNQADGRRFGAQLSYPNAVVLWLQCQQQVLDERLDKRVDKMIKAGLPEELMSFHRLYNQAILVNNEAPESSHAGYTKGVFQSIGFKEFHDYLVLSDDEKLSDAGQRCLQEGIEKMKTATRRYARYQNKWVRKRIFENRNQALIPPVYMYDSTDAGSFVKEVIQPAFTTLDEIMRGKQPSQPTLRIENASKTANPAVYQTCEICNVICVYKKDWDEHMSSRKHHKRLASVKREAQRQQKEPTERDEKNPRKEVDRQPDSDISCADVKVERYESSS